MRANHFLHRRFSSCSRFDGSARPRKFVIHFCKVEGTMSTKGTPKKSKTTAAAAEGSKKRSKGNYDSYS